MDVVLEKVIVSMPVAHFSVWGAIQSSLMDGFLIAGESTGFYFRSETEAPSAFTRAGLRAQCLTGE
jgi:hypothetical protein